MQYIKSASSRSIETIISSYLLQTFIRCLYLFALKSFVGNKLPLAENSVTFNVDAEQLWWRITYEASETEISRGFIFNVGKVNLTGHFLSVSPVCTIAGEVDWKC